MWRHGGLMVTAFVSGWSGPGSSHGRGHFVFVLGNATGTGINCRLARVQTFCQTIRRLQIKRTFLLLKSNLVWAVIEIISTYYCSFRFKELTLDPCPNGKPLAIKYDQTMFGEQTCWCCTEWSPSKQTKCVTMIDQMFVVFQIYQTRSNTIKHGVQTRKCFGY